MSIKYSFSFCFAFRRLRCVMFLVLLFCNWLFARVFVFLCILFCWFWFSFSKLLLCAWFSGWFVVLSSVVLIFWLSLSKFWLSFFSGCVSVWFSVLSVCALLLSRNCWYSGYDVYIHYILRQNISMIRGICLVMEWTL